MSLARAKRKKQQMVENENENKGEENKGEERKGDEKGNGEDDPMRMVEVSIGLCLIAQINLCGETLIDKH